MSRPAYYPFDPDAAARRRIEEATGARIGHCMRHPREIERRLRELDHEWDVERFVETGTSLLAYVGVALGTAVNRRFLWIPAFVATFLFQRTVSDWSPAMPVLRRLGVRTAREIDIERVALKMIRGDY